MKVTCLTLTREEGANIWSVRVVYDGHLIKDVGYSSCPQQMLKFGLSYLEDNLKSQDFFVTG